VGNFVLGADAERDDNLGMFVRLTRLSKEGQVGKADKE
jgi:hypothetical protein